MPQIPYIEDYTMCIVYYILYSRATQLSIGLVKLESFNICKGLEKFHTAFKSHIIMNKKIFGTLNRRSESPYLDCSPPVE